LHYAILIDNDEILVKLLELGADPNLKDLDGESPMESASKK